MHTFSRYKGKLIDWVGRKLTVWAIRFYPKFYEEKVGERVELVAKKMMLDYMDKSGQTHCVICPRTYSLRRISKNSYACEYHYQQATNVNKTLAQAGGRK